MSNYGNPPSDPYGSNQPSDPNNPYGNQPADGSYGQQPAYGQDPYGNQQAYSGVPAGVTFAHWGKRVGAYLIDQILMSLAGLPLWIGYVMVIASADTTTTTDPTTGMTTTSMEGSPSGASIALIALGALTTLAFFIWNYCIKQGKTGYTIGKGILGIKLVKADNGQPLGAGSAFVRQLAHIVDSIPCNIGYLWPLWDSKRQTFADKIMSTYVIDAPKG